MPVKLIKYLPHLVAALLLAAALGLAYRAGFQTAYHKQQVIIEQAEKDKSAALLASSRAFAAELERANARQQEQEEKTQQTGMKLAAANAEIGRLKQQYRKGIRHAIEQDKSIAGNACIDGLGTHGLRQYRQALGYGADQNGRGAGYTRAACRPDGAAGTPRAAGKRQCRCAAGACGGVWRLCCGIGKSKRGMAGVGERCQRMTVYRELIERQLAVRQAGLQIGLQKANEQEPFIAAVAETLSRTMWGYVMRMDARFEVTFVVNLGYVAFEHQFAAVKQALAEKFEVEADGDALTVESDRMPYGMAACRVVFGEV